MRAQAAVELLIILAIAMTMLGAIIATGEKQMSHGQTILRLEQTRSSVNDLANAANVAYREGDGSVRMVRFTIPDGVAPERVFVEGKFINVGVYVEGGESDVNAMSEAELKGSLPTSPGTYYVYAGARQGCVVIGANITGLDC